MTTEDDFQTALDADPTDWQTRLVFADWLQERDDPRADGYRALGANRLHPLQDLRDYVAHNWYFHCGKAGVMRHHAAIATVDNLLPVDWVALVDPAHNTRRDVLWVGYSTERRVVEEAIVAAFGKLPAPRRAELLAGVLNTEPDTEPAKRRPVSAPKAT